jgi:glucokinase
MKWQQTVNKKHMMNAIGIDIGGTNIKYALVSEQGEILFESIRKTESDPVVFRVLENIKKSIHEIIGFAEKNNLPIAGIGVGAPGIIDHGLVTACLGNLPELEGMPLGQLLNDHFSLPVKVDNDASLMGLAELRFGAAKGLTDVIFLTIGTGIGGAMVLNGSLYGGYQNRGGEFGHIHVASNGRKCTCGAVGCMEAMASVTALIEEYKSLLPEFAREPDGKEIVAQYQLNQEAALIAMNRHFDYLGTGIAGLINVFSPQKIIIGGGITEAGSFYTDQIRKNSLGKAMKETSGQTTIEAAMLGNKAGFLGAAALIFNSFRTDKTT